MEIKQRVNLQDIASLVGGVVLAAVLVLGAAMWAETFVPAFKARMARKARNGPLIKESRELGLTYDSVLADPVRAVGKPAVWCLRRISPRETLYRGEEGKSVYIENPHGMSNPSGSMHQTCTDTLLTIKTVTALDLGTVRGLHIEASFVDYL
ncbi:MAG: hypothetical protein Q7R35_05235 [Elusimicrobiota bacterium]|nr:hypothetical protein [Elusimicrobiota bacterium]